MLHIAICDIHAQYFMIHMFSKITFEHEISNICLTDAEMFRLDRHAFLALDFRFQIQEEMLFFFKI